MNSVGPRGVSATAPTIGSVALGIDTTRAFRFPDEVARLVEAVIAANSTDESTWIEWKGTLDLTQESAFHHLPRHVLGFANRDPGSAALNAEGYGYLIVGAEPGAVAGLVPIDPGDLSSRLRAYVGDRIDWHPQYVAAQGKQVLVIAVDPPRPGDSIHPLRKQMQNLTPGEILIRLPGQTVKARPEHIAMLESRAKASANTVDITVAFAGAARIERMPDLDPLIAPRIEEMRARLHDAGRGALAAEEDRGLTALMLRGTDDDLARYDEEIELFLNSWSRTVRLRRDLLHGRHAASHLKLTVRNNTDRNYQAVQANLFIARAQSPDLTDRSWPRLPAEPKPPVRASREFGFPFAALGASVGEAWRIPSFPYLHDPEPMAMVRVDPAKTLRRSHGPGGLLLEYPELDLRPRHELYLQSVPIDLLDTQADTVVIRWDVTAKNADGRLEGELTLGVADSRLDLSGIFSNADEPESWA